MVDKNPLEGKRLVVVTGYPRSGNIWVSRMIGSVLGAPVMGPPPFFHEALVSEGLERESEYVVVQGHFYGSQQDSFLCRSGIDMSRKGGAKVLLVVRDPRDVAMSVQHYWDLSSLKEAVEAMLHSFVPLDPNPVCGRAWHLFYDEWVQAEPDSICAYQNMRFDAEQELRRLFIQLDLPFDSIRIGEVASAYDILKRKLHMQNQGDSYYFGKAEQLKHIQSGIVSGWRRYWTKLEAELVKELWWGNLSLFGYEDDPNWHEKLEGV